MDALLTVQATVSGTLKRGLQQAAASVDGVPLAFAPGARFSVGAVSVGLAVLGGRTSRRRLVRCRF